MFLFYSAYKRIICDIQSIMKFTFFLIILILGPVSSNSFSAEIVDRIVAVVNDEIITYSTLNEAFRPYEKKIKEQNYPLTKEMEFRFQFRERLINQLIDEKVTEQEVTRLGIKIGSDEVDEAIERTKSMNSLTDEQLRTMLEADGMTMELYKNNMRNQLLRTRLIQYEVKSKIIVTKEEIDSYYEIHKSEFGDKPYSELESIITDKIYQMQVEKKFKKWISNLRDKAHIKRIN